jgi:hypothetical protein
LPVGGEINLDPVVFRTRFFRYLTRTQLIYRLYYPVFRNNYTPNKNNCLIFSLCSSLAKNPPILFPLPLQTQLSFTNTCTIRKSMFTCFIFPLHTSKLSSNCLKRRRFMKTNHTERILWPGSYFAILTNVAILNDQGKLPHHNCFK